MDSRPTLPDGWQWTKLETLAATQPRAIVSGPFGSSIGSRFFADSGIPVIRGSNLTKDATRFVDDGFVFLSEEKAAEFPNCQAIPGDLVLTAAGTLGQVGLIPETSRYDYYIISNKQLRARLDTAVVMPLYVFYWLSSPTMVRYIEQRNTGSTVPLINLSVLRALPIPLAPLWEQARIVAILGALDDKIELNRKMSRTLDETAQVIFKSRLIPHGAVPDDWSVRPLDSLGDFRNGLAMQRFPPQEGEPTLPVIKIAQLRAGNTVGADIAAANLDSAYLVRDGDVLFSWSGSLEAVWWSGGDGALNQHLFKVTSNEFPLWFVYQWIQYHLPEFRRIAAGKATTMGHINRGHLTSATTYVPPSLEIDEVGKIINPLVDRSVLMSMENRTLAAIRDALLPKLLSGELRVRDAEAIVEEAV